MGNCVAGEAAPETVRIMTDAGGIMELEGPVEVGTFLDDFPGYGLFKQGSGSAPLPKRDRLCNGQLYYLVLLPNRGKEVDPSENAAGKTAPASKTTAGPEVEVLPSPGKGVWKVRMVISREELAGILAEQGNTEALIERMRVAAAGGESSPRAAGKGGRGGGGWRPSLRSACRDGQEEHK